MHRIKPIGMVAAVLLVGLLLAYVFANREQMKVSEDVLLEYGQAAYEEGAEGTGLVWNFRARHRYLGVVSVYVDHAPDHVGSVMTIVVENNRGLRETIDYAIEGNADTEVYGIALSQMVGWGSDCKVTVYGEAGVLEHISHIYTSYTYNDLSLLPVLGWSSLLLLLALGVRWDYQDGWRLWVQRIFKISSYASVPFLMIFCLEYLGGSIGGLKAHIFITNVVICALLYLIVFMISNRLKFTALLVSSLVFVLGIAEYFVLLFRGSPLLLPYDLTSFHTAMHVLGQYHFQMDMKLVLSGFVFLAVISVCCCCPSVRISGWKRRCGFALGGSCVTVGLVFVFYGFLYPVWNLSYSTWAPIDTFLENGYLMSTMIMAKYATIQKPEGYSAKKAAEILSSYEVDSIEARETRQSPVNLIVVMNESWSRFDSIMDVETNVPYTAYYDSLSENTIKGNLYVSICGGNTPQTEYEFFTGNSISMLMPSATAYEFFVDEDTWSICDMLLHDSYRCLAMHPFDGGGYNRDKAYEYFGFEDFITVEEFEGYEMIRSFYSDEATYEKVIELYEGKEAGEKLFLWDLTMQNHGGYSGGSLEPEVFLVDHPEYEQAAAYLTLMKYTDEALEMLISYFAEVDEPTMIVMFGDHQPNLSDGVYDMLLGQKEEELEGEALEQRYVTPFLIWNNYGLETDYIEKMSANYLSSYVFQMAGFELDPYERLLLELYDYYPVINAQGIFDSDGTFWSWDTVALSENYEKLQNYQIVEYYRIKG